MEASVEDSNDHLSNPATGGDSTGDCWVAKAGLLSGAGSENTAVLEAKRFSPYLSRRRPRVRVSSTLPQNLTTGQKHPRHCSESPSSPAC